MKDNSHRLCGAVGLSVVVGVVYLYVWTSVLSKLTHNTFVCMSDTHSQVEHTDYHKKVPSGDVLLHAGDFTTCGEVCEFKEFNKFLEKLPHRIKLAIPGNHEETLDPRGLSYNVPQLRHELELDACDEQPNEVNYKDVVEKMLSLISNATILVDAWVSLCGIKIYGYPWMPRHGMKGFGLISSKVKRAKQALIPDDTDILLSHGPAQGYGDLTRHGHHVGCEYLAHAIIERIKPKLVVCGHIHEGHGIETDGETTYMNVSVCNRGYKPIQELAVLDYTLPDGYTREDVLQLDQRTLVVNNTLDEERENTLSSLL